MIKIPKTKTNIILLCLSAILIVITLILPTNRQIPEEYNDKIIVFSSHKEFEKETEYIKALFELQEENLINSNNVIALRKSTNKNDYKAFNVKEAPAIAKVSENGRIQVKITGTDVSKELIKEEISNNF